MLTVCQKWHRINLKGLTYEYVTLHSQNWNAKAKNKLFGVRRRENKITLVFFKLPRMVKKIQLLLNGLSTRYLALSQIWRFTVNMTAFQDIKQYPRGYGIFAFTYESF